MEEFKGMSRDTQRVKTPANMWEFARNILLTKGFNSISNEYGFDNLLTIPGKVLGIIPTNEETVFFSRDGAFSCIGIVKADTQTYIPILRTIYIQFNRPIEGVFLYNFKKDLIIVFSDGVYLDSSTPKLFNLTTLDFTLTPAKEFVNPTEANTLDLFANTLEGNIDISYGGTMATPIDIVYITYAYILADGISSTNFYPVHHIAYSVHQWREEKYKTIILTLSDLDPNYSKIKLGLLVNVNGELVGYESAQVAYINGTVVITIESLNNLKKITTEELVIPTIYYNRIKSLTMQNNQMVAGHLATDETAKVQKYFLGLELGIEMVDTEEGKFNHPTLCPDEVYAFYIQPQLLSGEYTDAYPLVGRKAIGNEKDIMTDAILTNMGLRSGTEGIDADVYKRFHIENSGGYVLPPPYDETNPLHKEMTFGYWENEETYPNHDEYNGSIDYLGNPIVGGEDLRNKPIRYFRIPGLDNITLKTPCVLGATEQVNNKGISNIGGVNHFTGIIPRFGIKLLNYDTVIPLEIREKFQAYRILIVKRKIGDRLVEDIPLLKQLEKNDLLIEDSILTVRIQPALRDPLNTFIAPFAGVAFKYKDSQFGFSKIYSPTFLHFKPKLVPKIIKANYGVTLSLQGKGVPTLASYTDATTVAFNTQYRIDEEQKYAVISNIEYLPGNNSIADTAFSEELITIKSKNYLQGVYNNDLPNYGTAEVYRWNPLLLRFGAVGSFPPFHTSSITTHKYNSATRIYDTTTEAWDVDSTGIHPPYNIGLCTTILNIQKNVYFGFNPTDFIILGKVLTTIPFKTLSDNGDIFTNNSISYPESYGKTDRRSNTNISTRIIFNHFFLKGWFGITNNAEAYILIDRKTSNPVPASNLVVSYITGAIGLASPSDIDLLNSFTYNFSYFNKIQVRSLNDLIGITGFSTKRITSNYFPFRVARTPKIPNENLQTNILRTFRANDYYEMLNNRGEVIAVRGTNKQLFIQQKSSLFVATLKDKLSTNESTTYLGEGDVFDRSPDEIKFNTDKGYIGCTNQFACIVCPEGYVVIDQVKGNIFVVGDGSSEITKANMTNWFEQNWDTKDYYYLDRFNNKQRVDNPFTSIGHHIGYDEKFNRLLFTKKYYNFKYKNLVDGMGSTFTFDGESYYQNDILLDFNDTRYFEDKSKTFSFDIKDKVFISEHDYTPNAYYTTNQGLFSVNNDIIIQDPQIDYNFVSNLYKHNSLTQKRGTYYNNKTFTGYIDLVFNSRLDLSKLYQAVEWESVVKTIEGATLYHKTIDKIMVYSDYQCSGEIPVKEFKNSRNVEGLWSFNEFRDLVVDSNLPIVDEEGRVVLNNLNNKKSYFEKSIFIGTFVIVRLIMSNENTDDVYINFVNVKSRISKR